MPATDIIRTASVLVYDGTNGAEIHASTGGALLSDSGTLLEIGDGEAVIYAFELGDAWDPGAGFWVKSNYDAHHITKAAALQDTVGTPNPTGKTQGVSVAVPLLLLGGSVDRVVSWPTAFADTGYAVNFLPDANTLGRITPVVKTGTKTASGLTVTISAGLAVTVAGVLHVLASGT